MNKSELKEMLKPLIKECIKEVIFEDGTLFEGSVPNATDVDADTNGDGLDNDNYNDVDPKGYTPEDDINTSEGNLTFNVNGSFTYDPEDEFQYLTEGSTKQISFNYSATDKENAKSNESTIYLIITGVNDNPIASLFLLYRL